MLEIKSSQIFSALAQGAWLNLGGTEPVIGQGFHPGRDASVSRRRSQYPGLSHTQLDHQFLRHSSSSDYVGSVVPFYLLGGSISWREQQS